MLDLPGAFLADGEPVKYLQKYKASLQRRFSLSRMQELLQAVDLGFYLTALQRPDEALEVVSFIGDKVKFDRNFNIWTPVGYGTCLRSRLLRTEGNHQAARDAMDRIRAHPFQVNETRERVTEKVAALPPKMDEACRTTSRKWVCHVLARTLYKACFYQEAGVHGLAPAEWVSGEALESLMLTGLGRLEESLQ